MRSEDPHSVQAPTGSVCDESGLESGPLDSIQWGRGDVPFKYYLLKKFFNQKSICRRVGGRFEKEGTYIYI